MPKSKFFWILLSLFQLVFGIVVFVATRNVYLEDARTTDIRSSDIAPSSTQENRPFDIDPAMLNSLLRPQTNPTDPGAIWLLANEHFAEKRYAQAAELYERLVTLTPSNPDVHNNLGLTLHYLGRSSEALATLGEGLALDSTNQRAWLTSGFVHSQSGNVDAARTALRAAIKIDANNEIGQSATKMLGELGQ